MSKSRMRIRAVKAAAVCGERLRVQVDVKKRERGREKGGRREGES